MATPHIQAEKGEISKLVLMPGDPMRAKFIAETFLQDIQCFNTVRGMLGYTGIYNNQSISVMGSGMGMPSMGIYSYELFTQYDVDSIIRIGSAGSYSPQAKIYDVILATASYSESSYAKTQNGYDQDTIFSNPDLNEKLRQSAKKQNIALQEGILHSSDVFYRQENQQSPPYWEVLREKKGCLAVEMESFALFHNANVTGKKAACLVTISDSFVTAEATTAQERQTSFTNMMKIALGVLE